MTYRAVRFENVGPIESGEIRSHSINVFVGPSGSGKSIAARIVHAVCGLAAPPAPHAGRDAAAWRAAPRAGRLILKSAGIPPSDAPAHGRASSSLEVDAGGGRPTRIDLAELARRASASGSGAASDAPPSPPPDGEPSSIYVPAGRPGFVLSLAREARMRGSASLPAQYRDLPSARDAPGGTARGTHGGPPPPAGGNAALPEHMGPFRDALLRSLAGFPTLGGSGIVSRMFGGSVGRAAGAAGAPATAYRSRGGFEAGIASAASGIQSAFSIAECASRARRGGMLVVEEPESGLDPMRQLLLVTELFEAAAARRLRLTLVVHSDHALASLLSLVAGGRMPAGDLGLYYFRQDGGPLARIEEVPVEEDGTAEQEMFDAAIEELGQRFV